MMNHPINNTGVTPYIDSFAVLALCGDLASPTFSPTAFHAQSQE